MQDYVGVIPVLAGQVRESASQIEHSVHDITGSFASLLEQARRAVNSARGARSIEASGGDVDDLIASSRQILQQLLDHSVKNAQLSMDAVARLEEVFGAMKIIGNTTKDIDRMAFGIRILAFNAKTESVQAGERGGMAWVADEVSHHADEAAAMAEGMRNAASTLESSLGRAMDTFRQLAEADLTGLIEGTDRADRAIGMLDAGNAAMRRELEASAVASAQLAEDLSRAVAAMQFQNRVNQRLQHVVATLSEMQDDFVAALERPDQPNESSGSAALRLRQRYAVALADSPSDRDGVELY